ncbi:39S ribosomal protein L22, mitochondrial [Schistocerca americana]|nr:39S ribosomal protein L22, mitochondrial [Schistocerca americana]XP_049958438.1 39S ribosomal protein L22, mitochondrial [Schistocerca serialis cubense]XP_049958439.1 39S ribosomal protein L22, mitochondrial [Schistocerca serialis cubense]
MFSCVKQMSALLPGIACFHTSSVASAWSGRPGGPRKWLSHNKKIYPPQLPDEEPRPAYVCHMKANIKYSPWKMWYIACLVRGLSVEEAVKQLSFVNKKGATYVRDTILEAQNLAVEKHNVEYKTNLWVAESFVGKGLVVKGIRRHARARHGLVEYFHCHYFVRLEEGKPPEHYYPYQRELSGQELLDKWLTKMRSRKITNSL